jgi:hypothetical protein
VTSRAVVLVEGRSDEVAVRTLAERRGRDLAAEGVSVLAVGGAQAMGRFLATYGPAGANAIVAELAGPLVEALDPARVPRPLDGVLRASGWRPPIRAR